MSGVWAEKREKRRKTILTAAATLFERQGYARTTFDQVAAASHCGVATIYKYFGNKESIVVALLLPSFEQTLRRAETVVLDPPDDAAEAMVKLLASYRQFGGSDWASREMLRLTVFPGLGNEGVLSDFVRHCDTRVQDQIRRLLVTLKARGRLATDLPMNDAIRVIFALLNQQFGAYLSDEGLSFAVMFRGLKRSVRLVFDDWRAPVNRPPSARRRAPGR